MTACTRQLQRFFRSQWIRRLQPFQRSQPFQRTQLFQRTRRFAVAVLVAFVAASALGCSPLRIVILSPEASGELTHKPMEFDLLLSGSLEPGTLEVTLNGVDVTDLFERELGTNHWIALDLWETNAPLLGDNALFVSGTFNGDEVAMVRRFETDGDPFADCVDDVSLGTDGGFGSQAQVLGAPQGGGAFSGSTDVLSLGLGGWIVVEFRDNTIVDGPGVDFTVFENPFLPFDLNFETLPPFMEPGRVSVSQDGSTWHTFPCALASEEAVDFHPGCAGVYPIFSDALDPATPHAAIPSSTPIEDLIGQDIFNFPTPAGAGGDSFDLADVGLEWAAFVRIEGASFLAGPTGPSNAGFDLDAVAAIHSEPSGVNPACP